MIDQQEEKEFQDKELENKNSENLGEDSKVEEKPIEEEKAPLEEQEKKEEKAEKAEEQKTEERTQRTQEKKRGLNPEEEEKIRQALRERFQREQQNRNFQRPPRKRGGKFSFAGLLFLVFLIAAIFSYPKMKFSSDLQEIKEVSYSNFVREVENKKIKRVEEKDGYILGYVVEGNKEFRLTAKEEKNNKELIYKTRLITNRLGQDTQLVEKLVASGLDIKALDPPQTPFILNLLASSFPFILLMGLWFFMFRGAGKGGGGPQIFSVGKSKAKENGENITQVSFADVAGIDEAKHELQEVVEFLREPDKFKRMGAKIPKGVLLLGSPGTGKTLLAKAVAGEAKVPFFSMSGSEFVEMFVGVGASRVRDLFAKARKNAPCIVFIDEIDAVGRKRGSGQGGGNDEREQTLNQLLVEMDGFGTEETIIVLAATNRPDVLDRALKRPGRFDRQVTVDAPDVKGRQEILAVHAKNKKIDSSVDLKIIAKKTVGMVGADLANLLNEAAILAARSGREAISMADLEEASEKVVMGPEKRSKVIPEEEKRLVAYHEVGHAIVNHVLGGETKVHKITMIPRGMAGGYTMSLPIKEKPMYTKKYFLTEMAIFFGGRAAEEIIFGKDYITAGASSDIERATSYAQLMVTKLGMTDKFGPVLLDGTQEGDMFQRKYYSEQTGKEVDDEIRKIINECYQLALKTLRDYREKLEEVTKVLLEKETIMGDEFETLMKSETASEAEEEKVFTKEE